MLLLPHLADCWMSLRLLQAKKNNSSKSKRGLSLWRTSFNVLDETDKMLAMRFKSQVREVLNTMLLSAASSRHMEQAAQEWLRPKAFVRIAVGTTGEASEHVQQVSFSSFAHLPFF